VLGWTVVQRQSGKLTKGVRKIMSYKVNVTQSREAGRHKDQVVGNVFHLGPTCPQRRMYQMRG
jgi:hypothetical protein